MSDPALAHHAADLGGPAAEAERARRAWIFAWLGQVFAVPPSRELVAAYRRGEVAPLLERLAEDPELAPGIAAMARAVDAAPDDDATTARLGIAFGRLFLGIGGPDTVSPYESVHRCGGRLFQAPASEMAALLAAHDLSVAAATREPPDHLAVELDLMARLIATDHPDRSVLLARLAAWVPTFCELCAARDASGFWAGAAAVLLAALDQENRDADFAFPQSPINQRRIPCRSSPRPN